MSAKYTVANLEEIAEAFELFASDQIGCIRMQTTKKAKEMCQERAAVWRDAADLIRNTTIKAAA